MGAKRAFLVHLPGDPLSDYLRAVLPHAPGPEEADALVLPRLTKAAAEPLERALAAGKPAFLPAEALPRRGSGALGRGLSALEQCGLILCPLTALPRWVQTGASCRGLLTVERLRALAAAGVERVYLAGRPGATPLAAAEAKRQNIHLTRGDPYGTGQGHRFGVVHQEE